MLIPTGYERLLPPSVQLTVRSRRRAMARRARGRVLDLGGADSHTELWRSLRPVDEVVTVDEPLTQGLDRAAEDGPFDTVFSVFRLCAVPDLAAVLRRMSPLLGVDGRMLFLEPARLTGASGRAQRLVAPTVVATAGWHVERDIPVELRRSGLSVIDIERHRVGTLQWWLRWLVEGTAHPALETGPRPPASEST